MTSFEYEILKEDVELWKEARGLLRDLSVKCGDAKCIEQVKMVCEKLTADIIGFNEILGEKDDWKFDAVSSKPTIEHYRQLDKKLQECWKQLSEEDQEKLNAEYEPVYNASQCIGKV